MAAANGTFKILERNRQWFDAQIEKLSKRSIKLLGPEFKITPFYFGYEMVPDAHGHARKVYDVLLTAEEPKINGWEFIAKLDHSSDKDIGTIVRVVPGKELPIAYHHADHTNCDHCGHKRYRRDTYVVRNVETNEHKQVGSSCLRDFLGHDVEKIAKLAGFLTLAADIVRLAGSEREIGYDRRYIVLETYLAHVAAAIRTGGWVTRKTAGEKGVQATADIAFGDMLDKAEVKEDDIVTAQAAIEWAQSLTEQQRENDYLHNVSVIAASGFIEHRSIGLAGSIVGSFKRNEIRNNPSVPVKFDNFDEIVKLLTRAGSRVKAPHINIRVNDRDLRLKVSKGGKFPGCVYATETVRAADGKFPWLGRIMTDGTYDANRYGTTPATQTAVQAALQAFNADPAGIAGQYGKLTGYCCFCSKPLTHERSLVVGYGAKCASNYELPW